MGSYGKQSQANSSTPTFESPEARNMVNMLSGTYTNRLGSGQGNTDAANSRLLQLLQGGINPYVESAIKTSNDEATSAASNLMAGARAGGYRGGTAANFYTQGGVANDLAQKLASANANLRVNAFDTGENRALSAAGGLISGDNSTMQNANALLSLLRGEKSTGSAKSSSFSPAQDLGAAATGLYALSLL